MIDIILLLFCPFLDAQRTYTEASAKTWALHMKAKDIQSTQCTKNLSTATYDFAEI
jgi:hypothetical protein